MPNVSKLSSLKVDHIDKVDVSNGFISQRRITVLKVGKKFTNKLLCEEKLTAESASRQGQWNLYKGKFAQINFDA